MDGIHSSSCYHYLPIGIHHWLGEAGCTAVVCEVVCYMEVRPGLPGKKKEVALQQGEMRMVRWMCDVKATDKVPSKQLRERPGIDDIILVLQQNRLWWYEHVLRKEDTDWVNKCMEYELEGSRPRGRPKRTWRDVVQKDSQVDKLNRDDAMDRCRQKKLMKTGWWSGW